MIQMIQMSQTITFSQVWDEYNKFKIDFDDSPFTGAIHEGEVTAEGKTMPDNLEILYYLLYAKFGNSFITNLDINQWKFKVFSTIWKYGPAWEKKLEIQANLKGLDIESEDFLKGAKAIYNKALNPETEPSTNDLKELKYINEQNTTNYKKSKMDALTQLWNLIATDVTESFLERFAPLFKRIWNPGILFESEE